MLRGSEAFEAALVDHHQLVTTCTALVGALRHPAELPIVDGSITNDSGTSATFVRRKGTLTLRENNPAARTALADLLETPGIELRITSGVRLLNGVIEDLPVIAGPVESVDSSWPDGQITVQVADQGVRPAYANFLTPRISPKGYTITRAIRSLIGESLPLGLSPTAWHDTRFDGSILPSLAWDWSRVDAIAQMAMSIGAEVFPEPDGIGWTIRHLQTLSNMPVWNAQEGTTLLSLDRSASQSKIRNAFRVESNRPDSSGSYAGSYTDKDPQSPTSARGPLGLRSAKWETSVLLSNAQCAEAARSLVARWQGARLDLSITNLAHPGLETGEVIQVTQDDRAYRVILDSYTLDLFSGVMQCKARSLDLPDVSI